MRGGLKFDRTMGHVNHLVEEMLRRNVTRPALWITMVDTEIIDARKAVEYWRDRGVNAGYTLLENRGGNLKDAEDYSHSEEMDFFSDCTRLFKQAYIKFDGDLVLCCTDYETKMVLGNVREKSLYEVWNGPVATEIRRKFLTNRIGKIPLCSVCKIDREKEVEVRARRPLSIGLPDSRLPAPPVPGGPSAAPPSVPA